MTRQNGQGQEPLVHKCQLDFAASSTYQVKLSRELNDTEWDEFLEKSPGGHHVQTSLWAQVKASLGWNSLRILILRSDEIVAGAQILMRTVPLVGAIGYVSKGPVVAVEDPVLEELVVAELQRTARANRIQHLTVQPPGIVKQLPEELAKAGFQRSSMEVAPTATVLLDLSRDLDTILADMNRKTRYNVRLGQRKGITVREGNEQDLPEYYRILTTTSQRQSFSIYPEYYFAEMWRVLSPHGYIKLFLAEFEGELVSAQLAVPFGDTVINKLSVWSGQHGSRRPNEALQWAAITWAKSQGYRFYDFEGIRPEAARAVLNQETIPEALKQTVTSFKLGFSDHVVFFPPAYDYVYNPLFRWFYTEIFPKVKKQPAVTRILKRVRTGSSIAQVGSNQSEKS